MAATMKTVEKRRMCPNCRAFITIKDRVCPYCDAQLGPRAIDLRAAQFTSSLLPRANLTSIIFLTINVAFFILEVVINYKLTNSFNAVSFDPRTLVVLGGKYSPAIQQGQWWRLITAGFLHGGILHILMNSWALFDLIGEVEQFYGTSRLIVAYIFSTFTGFLLSFFFSRSISIGASAPCFGLIGVMLAIGLRRDSPLAQAIRSYYRRWLIYGLVFSLLPFVDISAHIGGLAGGFLVGSVGGLPGLPDTPRETVWRVLAATTVLVVIYAFFQHAISYAALMRGV